MIAVQLDEAEDTVIIAQARRQTVVERLYRSTRVTLRLVRRYLAEGETTRSQRSVASLAQVRAIRHLIASARSVPADRLCPECGTREVTAHRHFKARSCASCIGAMSHTGGT